MNVMNPKDRTIFFQELERELDLAKPEGLTLRSRLKEAENDIRKFFENPGILTKALNAGGLTYEHAFLKRTADKPKYPILVEQLLAEYRRARDLDPTSFYDFWASQQEIVNRGTINIASVATLQTGKEGLELDVLVKSYFRDSGDALEGSLLPLLRLRLEVWGILGERRSGAPKTRSMTFGSIVEELLSRPMSEEIYRPAPHALTVSQWRNIAFHNSYRVENGIVVCNFGANDRPKEIRLSLGELIAALLELNDVFYAHKVAYEIFGVDSAAQLAGLGPEIKLSEYSSNVSLAHGLAAAGFSVRHAEQSNGLWSFAVVDKRARSQRQIKTALQEAVWSYVMFVNPTEFRFLVRSDDKAYRFGFVSTVQRGTQPLPPNFRGDVWSVDESLALVSRDPSK